MRLAALVNLHSGSGRGSEILDDLTANGVTCDVLEPGVDIQAWAERSIADGAEALVAAGGDGTIATVAQVAAGRVPIAVAPVGTRNHFALDLGLDPDDPVTSLRASLAGEPTGIDVGEMNGEIFLNNASFGIYAAAVADPEYRSGRLKVLANAARGAVTSTGETATISAPMPIEIPEDAVVGAALIANNAYEFVSSPGQRLRPTLTSGHLWVYLLGIPQTTGRLPLMKAVREVLTSGGPSLGAWPVTDAVIESDRPVPTASDGEYRPDMTPPYRIRSRHKALDVLMATKSATSSTFTLQW